VLSKLTTNDFASFQDYYQFQADGEDRVAGKQAQRVLIKPRDAYRYGYRLWLDEANNLLLKSDLLDENGRVLEQAMFANIAVVEQIPDAMLAPTTQSEGYAWFRQNKGADPASAEDSLWRVGHMPDGFTITSRYRHPLPNSATPAEHLIASDGLASVSVYIEKLVPALKRFVGASNMGAVNAYGMVTADHQITVIGEVPAATVEMIAHSVTQQGKEAKP
jgi:sigma-E factor negative regulatory protein RseB